MPIGQIEGKHYLFFPYFAEGFSYCNAAALLLPFDTVKVRVQLLGMGGTPIETRSPLLIATRMIKNERFSSLFRGLTASMLRQATYSGSTMWLSEEILSLQTPFYEFSTITPEQKFNSIVMAGTVASFISTPFEVILTRKQSDGILPQLERRAYGKIRKALYRIVREEGITTLFRGAVPSIFCGIGLNLSLFGLHDYFLVEAMKHSDNSAAHNIVPKALCGVVATVLTMPFDFVKTRLQFQKKLPDGKLPYRGLIDCVRKVTAQEGAKVFYRGFWTYYARTAPLSMLALWLQKRAEADDEEEDEDEDEES